MSRFKPRNAHRWVHCFQIRCSDLQNIIFKFSGKLTLYVRLNSECMVIKVMQSFNEQLQQADRKYMRCCHKACGRTISFSPRYIYCVFHPFPPLQLTLCALYRIQKQSASVFTEEHEEDKQACLDSFKSH